MQNTHYVVSNAGHGARCIRVFLSSTFQDMQSERNYLIEHTFHTFRHIAAQRHVDFSVVDLRWGVTEEEAHEGKVIEICLNEINQTRPFFIGLVGNRYGWCPTHEDVQKNPRLLNVFPEIRQYIEQGLSMTEIEMQYGVLSAAEKVYANFYIKSGQDTKNTPEEQLRLDNLRCTIIQKSEEGLCRMAYYDTAEQLGEKVLKSLIALLDELYPQELLDETAMLVERQRYLLRQMQAVYENDSAQETMRRTIAQFVFQMQANRHCVAITTKGESVGKSAFAANWGFSKDARNIIRTILNNEDNTSEIALRHLYAEMQLRGLSPSDYITWTIDGLDYLETKTDRALGWLLDERLHDIQLVLTANDPVILRNIESFCNKDDRAGSTLYIGAILEEDAKKIIPSFLKQFAKGLSQSQIDKIARNKLFLQNVLFLKLFLHELIQFGVYEKLDEFMSPYLEATTASQLIDIILRRLEKEHGKDVVSTYFGFLSLTECGIPEADLQRLTGLDAIRWSALRSSTNLFLDTFQPIINLNSYVRKYVCEHYSADQGIEKKRHILKDLYFSLINERISAKQEKDNLYACFCREYVGLQLADEGPEKTFTRNACLIWNKAIDDIALCTVFANYINCSASLLHACMSDEMICSYSASGLLDFIRLVLNDDIDAILDFEMHMEKRNIPELAKDEWDTVFLAYLKKIQEMMETETASSEEETWESKPLHEFSIYDLVDFETRVITITDLDTIKSIRESAEKLIRRFIENDTKREFAPIVAELFTILSYCYMREKNYDAMRSFHSLAAHTNPEGFDAFSMTTFQINLVQNLDSECENIIYQMQQNIGRINDSDRKKHFLGTLYAMQLLYSAHKNQINDALNIVDKILNLWYPEDIEETFNIVYWTATLMEINEFFSYAGIMYKKAGQVASDQDAENMCKERSMRCLQLAGE